MTIESFIAIIVVPIALIAIPLIWKLTRTHKNDGTCMNWKNGVMNIDCNAIYLASALNRKAKKSKVVASETCDSFIQFNDNHMIYQADEGLRYLIPLSSIESVVDGVDYYDVIRDDERHLYHRIVIKLKVGSCITIIINGDEEMVRKSESGYNNTVEIDDLNLVPSDHKMLLGKIVDWKGI